MSTTILSCAQKKESRSHHQGGNPHACSVSSSQSIITHQSENILIFATDTTSVLTKVDRYSIYALADQGSVQYIGMSKNPSKRFYQHIHCAYSPSAKDTWIRGFLEHGMLPELVILETGLDQKTAGEREKYWIAFYSERGPLLNSNLNTKQQPGGTRIDDDDPEFEEHAYQQIMRERENYQKFLASRGEVA